MLKFFANKYIYIGLLSIIIFGVAILLVVDRYVMPAYTNYNEGITVPDVTRISLEEAEDILTTYGLRVEIAERRSNSAFPADYVIDQSPTPSLIVKPDRKVYLTVNTATRPQVEVPGVVNLSYRNAEIQLQNYGLEVGSVSYESSRFKNAVLRQSVAEGTIVEKGTTIDLTISDGLGDDIVKIPEIIGLRLSEAQQKLSAAGLRVGPITFKPTRDVAPNTVLDFTPKTEEIREGETLTLVISERYEAIEQSEEGAVIIDSTDNEESTPPDSLNEQSNNEDN